MIFCIILNKLLLNLFKKFIKNFDEKLFTIVKLTKNIFKIAIAEIDV